MTAIIITTYILGFAVGAVFAALIVLIMLDFDE